MDDDRLFLKGVTLAGRRGWLVSSVEVDWIDLRAIDLQAIDLLDMGRPLTVMLFMGINTIWEPVRISG